MIFKDSAVGCNFLADCDIYEDTKQIWSDYNFGGPVEWGLRCVACGVLTLEVWGSPDGPGGS